MTQKVKEMVLIHPSESLNLITESHILISFFVSNDLVQVGTITIPQVRNSSFEKHNGDEVIYVLKGKISILIEEGDQSVSKVAYEVKAGERFFVPTGIRHRYQNFQKETAKFLFSIAPGDRL
ncbi:MAG: cupin domain-containing protein [Candidatus Firestonebacteria bacterium]